MTKTFFPILSKLVEASPPHKPNTFYKVSVGMELLPNSRDEYHKVSKIQIYRDGRVLRKDGTIFAGSDAIACYRAIDQIKERLDKDDEEGFIHPMYPRISQKLKGVE